MGSVGRVVAVLAAVGITVGALALGFGAISGGAGGVWDSVRGAVSPEYQPARPSGAEATSSLPDHQPELAIDGISNSYWAEGAQGNGEGETLVLTFDRPVDLDRIGITPGASGEVEEFIAQPRPQVLHLVFSDGSATDVNLKDSAEFQTFPIEARQVTSVEVHVVSVFAALDGDDTAISEIELFTKG